MRVIGTAGHVDHGKSTLIEALSGIHPDRLREEREREMTIVLGFAWLDLPNGEEIGIVDVPGHRDFIENMLSGVGAIDAALFVVAADEGVMPQTREHLAILDLLQIQGGVVALTKTDLIDDPEWLELVEAEVREVLSGTVLESAPIVPVSARTKTGIPELLDTLAQILAERPARPDLDRPRLPVDRVFTMAGFGTVVTGTLMDGSLTVGDEVVILPEGLKGRIRGLQTHKRKEQTSIPGSRTAINISGVDHDQIQRGDIIAHPADYAPTRRLDVHFRLLPDVSQPVRHNMEVKLFIGASEILARLRLLGTDVLNPGESGWLQLELQHPVVAIRNDRYILRRPSPGETLGGGVIVDPQPKGRHKRFNQKMLARLEALVGGTPEDVVLQALIALGVAPLREVVTRSSLDEGTAWGAIESLAAQERLLSLEAASTLKPDSLVISNEFWESNTQRAIRTVRSYHQNYPLRTGMPREELKSRLKFSPRVFNAIVERMVAEEKLATAVMGSGTPGGSSVPVVREPGFEVRFSPRQQKDVDSLLAQFRASPYAPPTIKESVQKVGDEIYNALVVLGKLVPVSSEVVFEADGYADMVDQIRQILLKQGTISVAEVRDRFNTSRRYVLAILEHLDAIGVTLRVGDVRKLKGEN